MDFKEAFRPPFTADDCYIWTADRTMAFDFIPCGLKIPLEDAQCIVEVLNGGTNKIHNHLWKVNQGIFFCYFAEVAQPIMRVRGWGHLTGGLNLSPDEAAKIQDDFVQWALNKLNNSEPI